MQEFKDSFVLLCGGGVFSMFMRFKACAEVL